MPSLSIIMAAHVRNEQQLDWLHEAIASCMNQTQRDMEIVLVDDASPVPFPATYRYETRQGPGKCRNQAVKMAQGEWLLALDADDRLMTTAIADLWPLRCPDAVIYGDAVCFGEEQHFLGLPDFSIEYLKTLAGPIPVTGLHHRSAHTKVGGWSEDLEGLEDLEYWLKMAKIGVCGIHSHKTILEYRKHGGSRTSALLRDNHKKLNEQSRVIKARHSELYAEGAVMPTCSKCPGSGQQGYMPSVTVPDGLGPGQVEMRYIGMRQGSYAEKGPTGVAYNIEGKGAYFMADPRDVQYFLGKRRAGLPEFEVVVRNPDPSVMQSVRQVTAPTIQPSPELVNITDLSEAEAVDLIVRTSDGVDLRTWLAEEKTMDNPREEVLTAIFARASVLMKGSAA